MKKKILKYSSSFFRTLFQNPQFFTPTFPPMLNSVQIRHYSHIDEEESVWKIFSRTFKENLKNDESIQEESQKLEETYTAQKIRSSYDVAKEGGKYVYEKTEGIRMGIQYTTNKTGEILYESVDLLGKGIDVLSEQGVIKAVIDELNREYRLLLECQYSFRSEYQRKDDFENGIIFNPYTKQYEQIDESDLDTDTFDVSVNVDDDSDKLSKVSGANFFARGINATMNAIGSVGEKMFRKNEQSECLALLKERDDTFDLDLFIGNVKNILIPVVMQAYFDDDKNEIKRYLSTHCYRSSLWPLIQQRTEMKTHFETKILSINNTDLLKATFHENEPIIILSSNLQYIHCLVDDETGEIVEGSRNDIREVNQLWGFMQDPTYATNDWEVIELIWGVSLKLAA